MLKINEGDVIETKKSILVVNPDRPLVYSTYPPMEYTVEYLLDNDAWLVDPYDKENFIIVPMDVLEGAV